MKNEHISLEFSWHPLMGDNLIIFAIIMVLLELQEYILPHVKNTLTTCMHTLLLHDAKI
jgi:hypothetical protein